MLSIKEFNKTVDVTLVKDVLTVEEFRTIHKNTPSTKLEGIVRRISSIDKIIDGYVIHFDNDVEIITVKYDGSFAKKGQKCTQRFDAKTGRSRVNILNYNSSLYCEKLIGICDAWLHNELPINFRGLTVNVMDGTGCLYTAQRLGLDPNFHEENLEWTTLSRNSWHGNKIMKLAALTGKAYRFSANDNNLKDACDLQGKLWIRHYMLMHYKKIKDLAEC